ncbi:MAG: ABC transporter ATP-binding protein [Clostridiales bacterium]|nr:ABC transporter ATP-binding protein [Clostridiales bacterium]
MSKENISIEVINVSKNFKEVEVLKDISLKCSSGRIYGIVGHNGSGKTVLFKCICGFLSCSKGEIMINGEKMGKDIDMLTNAGIIIEEPGFLRNWNAYHNLEFLYTIRNKRDKGYLRSALEQVGLDPALKRPVGKYSLGMRQRLAIAQAIMEKPDILILDEPMNGLDRAGVSEMRNLFLQMKAENKLLLLASHNKEDISTLCDEVYEMEDGRLTKVNYPAYSEQQSHQSAL